MFLESIAHAVPAAAFTQAECWEIIQRSGELDRLNSRSASLLEAILNGNSGIEKRHLATNEVERIFSLGAEALNQNFEQAAPALSIEALTQALTLANLVPESLDALFICTCTGYLCPGISSYVAQHLGLRPNAFLQDIVGLGCGAAIPTLRSAAGCLAANPEARVACIAVEVCSAAFTSTTIRASSSALVSSATGLQPAFGPMNPGRKVIACIISIPHITLNIANCCVSPTVAASCATNCTAPSPKLQRQSCTNFFKTPSFHPARKSPHIPAVGMCWIRSKQRSQSGHSRRLAKPSANSATSAAPQCYSHSRSC